MWTTLIEYRLVYPDGYVSKCTDYADARQQQTWSNRRAEVDEKFAGSQIESRTVKMSREEGDWEPVRDYSTNVAQQSEVRG